MLLLLTLIKVILAAQGKKESKGLMGFSKWGFWHFEDKFSMMTETRMQLVAEMIGCHNYLCDYLINVCPKTQNSIRAGMFSPIFTSFASGMVLEV